jgi:hypothetical protein
MKCHHPFHLTGAKIFCSSAPVLLQEIACPKWHQQAANTAENITVFTQRI